MATTTWTGDGANNLWTNAANWDNGAPTDSLDAIIPDCTSLDVPLLESTVECRSLTMVAGADINGNGNNLEIHGEADGTGVTQAGYCIWVRGKFTNSLDVEILAGSSTNCSVTPSDSSMIRDLKVNESTVIFYTIDALSLSRNLNINQGKYDTQNNNLTVPNLVTVNGTFVGGTSTLTFGSLKGTGTFQAPTTVVEIDDRDESTGKALDIDGLTVTTNDFNVNITSAKNQDLEIGDDKIHDLTINQDTDARINYFTANGSIDGDLTITRGILNTFNRTLTVDGDCSIAADGKLEANVNGNVAVTLGSLTIASGGIYNATSATTTITGTSNADWNWTNNGTFTPNNGKVKFFTDSTSMEMWISNGDTFYDLEIDSADPSGVYYHNNIIYGDLTVTDGPFHAYTTSTTLTVHGNTYIKSEGQLINGAAQSGTVTFHGLITNEGILHTGSGTNNFNGGVRNLATMASDDTITIGGTGAILEGDLDDAIINVNQDVALEFDGVNDLISVGNIGTHSQWTISFWCRKVGTGEDGLIDGNDASSSSFPYITANPANFYVYYDNGSGGASNTSFAMDMTVWNHFAITYDAEASNNLKTYCNGVLKTTVDANNGSAPTTFTDFTIGDNANYGKWDGFMADVKTFNDDLGIDDIKILASKINVDPTLVSKTANLTGWWKINDASSTIDDFVNSVNGGTNHNGTLTGGDWRYNQYSVNVQKDGTTTDGNFTVTQGKLEGLALSNMNFDGTNDEVTILDAADLDPTDGYLTLSAWIYPDNVSAGARGILTKRDATEQAGAYHFGQNGDELQFLLWSGADTSTNVATTTSPLVASKWQHVAMTFDDTTNELYFYVDGVEVGSDLSTITNDFTNTSHPFRIGYSGQGSEYFDGKIRDARFYDRVLSADQIASLYSNSSPPTPNHWWKMDEGIWTGTYNVLDSGTGTANNGNAVGATFQNGTLDLDGTLTIAANGTLSAPRGTLSVADSVSNAGTYTHNDGTFEWENTTGDSIIGFGSVDPVFYNLAISTSTTNDIFPEWSFTVRNVFDTNGQQIWIHPNSRDVTITMGFPDTGDDKATALSTGATTIGLRTGGYINSTLKSYQNHLNDIKLYGASQLYPAKLADAWLTFTHTSQPDCTWYIKNFNVQSAFNTTHTAKTGSNAIIILDGDCEFAAFDVTSGDKLDINGQRAEFSGQLDNSGGVIKDGGANGLIILKGSGGINYSSPNWTDARTLNSAGTALWADCGTANMYLQAYPFKTIFLNGGETNMVFGLYGPKGGDTIFGQSDVICASKAVGEWGTDGSASNASEVNNLTVVDIPGGWSGSGFNPGTNEVKIGGDLKITGGLIGKTGLYNNDIYNVQFAHNADQSWDTGASADGCFEGWFKADSFGYEVLARSNGPGKWLLLMNTNDINFHVYDNSNTETVLTVTHGLSVNKWFHVACVADGTSQLMYIDGKLVGSRTKGAGIKAATVGWSLGANPGGSAYTFDGHTHNFRVWKEARTAAEIRANMFKTEPTDTNSKLAANINFMAGGSGGTVTDAAGNGNGTLYKDDGGHTTTTDAAAWAGAGTFTYSNTSLTMDKSGTQYIYGKGGLWMNNLTVDNGSTTKLSLSNSNSNHTGDLITVGTGVFESDNSETVYLRNAGDTITVGTAATGIAGINGFITALGGGSLSFPACTVKSLTLEGSGDTVSGGGDMIFTTKLQIKNGTEFSCNGKSHTAYTVDLDGTGRINLNGASLTFSNTAGLTSEVNSTIAASNTTITGVAGKSTFQSQNNWELVGTVENLDVTNEELNVTGKVINCTGEIHQWHNTIDSNQQLDRDTADDRDINLGRDLDKNTELVG